jgi:hypothetical protein
MRTRLSTLIVLAIYLAVWPSAAATAACETQLEFETALEVADSVFVAQIAAISDGGATAQASVKGVWKGPDLPRTVNLWGGDSSEKVSGTTRIHEVGQTYLVVAEWSRSAFVDDKCTATRLYGGLATEIPRNMQDAVGATEARLALPSEPANEAVNGAAGSIPTRLFVVFGIVIVLGMLGAVALSRLARFKPRRTAPAPGLSTDASQHKRKRKQPKQPKRSLAGWVSGRFSRSGKRQVDQLKKK